MHASVPWSSASWVTVYSVGERSLSIRYLGRHTVAVRLLSCVPGVLHDAFLFPNGHVVNFVQWRACSMSPQQCKPTYRKSHHDTVQYLAACRRATAQRGVLLFRLCKQLAHCQRRMARPVPARPAADLPSVPPQGARPETPDGLCGLPSPRGTHADAGRVSRADSVDLGQWRTRC